MEKKTAYIYHHTHWDNEWYFTGEDSNIQLVYHMKELMDALEHHQINTFFLDGQTAIVEDYLNAHPEDRPRITALTEAGRLSAGPFHAQLDCFISSGESVINNLKLGIRLGDSLGGVNRVAYLPDSFGHSQDFPKVFSGMGIRDFVFRRGMGDEHHLPNEFIWDADDGSSVLCSVINSGYGFATEPFVSGTLLEGAGLDYDGKDIAAQMEKLSELSALPDGFLLPIGNDQTPVIRNFNELLAKYNAESHRYRFQEVTLSQYMEKLRRDGENFKHYQGEFLSPQYHRVHKSIGSARADIKNIQDRIERLMAYEIQPMMCVLDRIGLPYDRALTDRIWNLLIRSQTHSGATNTDKTNELILKRSEISRNLAEALKIYLVRKVALTAGKKDGEYPVVVFNSLPYRRSMTIRMEVYTRTPEMELVYRGQPIMYTLLGTRREYGGTIRSNMESYDAEKFYYAHDIAVALADMPALGYETLTVRERAGTLCVPAASTGNVIENDFYSVWLSGSGSLHLMDKKDGRIYKDILYWEESGDAGDNYDYSNLSKDWRICKDFAYCTTADSIQGADWAELRLRGSLAVPAGLEERAERIADTVLPFAVTLTLKRGEPVLHVDGVVNNTAKNHRVRLVVHTPHHSENALAGTQFGVIARPVHPETLDIWKRDGWLEEPSPIDPLLNHVALADASGMTAVFSKGVKEYEILNGTDIALTLFRCVGHLGLPDLERRPGRASGLAERIIPSPLSQMQGENRFSFAVSFSGMYDANRVGKLYVEAVTSEIYYQNQRMNKVVYPISYFETNPLPFAVPESFSLFEVKDFEGVFSTVSAAADGKGYILRLSNQNGAPVTAGAVAADTACHISKVNLAETEQTTLENGTLALGRGEICTVRIAFES